MPPLPVSINDELADYILRYSAQVSAHVYDTPNSYSDCARSYTYSYEGWQRKRTICGQRENNIFRLYRFLFVKGLLCQLQSLQISVFVVIIIRLLFNQSRCRMTCAIFFFFFLCLIIHDQFLPRSYYFQIQIIFFFTSSTQLVFRFTVLVMFAIIRMKNGQEILISCRCKKRMDDTMDLMECPTYVSFSN